MNESRRTEGAVGWLLTAVVAAGLAVAVRWGAGEPGSRSDYDLTADFSSIGGLQPGASVEIAGVPVGSVGSVSLRHDQAHVVLHLAAGVRIPVDSTAAVRATGLIGETYVAIQPGHGGTRLPPGARITRTEPPPDLRDGLTRLLDRLASR